MAVVFPVAVLVVVLVVAGNDPNEPVFYPNEPNPLSNESNPLFPNELPKSLPIDVVVVVVAVVPECG